MKITQALICWMAGKEFTETAPDLYAKYGVSSTWMHGIANAMEDCTSYDTHKYIDHKQIDRFMGRPDGSGVHGFWSFRDGSKLVGLCAVLDRKNDTFKDGWVILQDSEDDEPVRTMYDMESWPKPRSEAVVKS